MKGWEKIRISLLAAIFGGVLFVLGKSLLYPTGSQPTLTPFNFPPAVSLPQWQPLASTPLENKTAKSPKFLSGRRYHYIQNGVPLDIEMRYFVITSGEIESYIKTHTAISSSADKVLPVLRQKEGVGFYSLFAHQGRAYLSACINPRGGSTVTDEQFRRNRYTYDVRSHRFLPWLLGQAELRDMRCLWAHLSVPLNNSSPEDAYQTLEKAWFSWYQWWSPRFPNP